ncbi:MAG: hypothetical protein AB1405_03860 [Bdellovibrionota bacterium]
MRTRTAIWWLRNLPGVFLLAALAAGCEVKDPSGFRRLAVGPMANRDAFAPVALGTDALAVRSAGPDGVFVSRDDELVVLRDLDGAQTLLRVPLPYLSPGEASHPVALSADALVLATAAHYAQLESVRVENVANNRDYSITLNGEIFRIRSDADATALEISAALAACVNTPASCTNNPAAQPVTATDMAGTIVLEASAEGEYFAVAVTADLSRPQIDLITVEVAADSTPYIVEINGTPFQYISGTGALPDQIATGLAAAINGGTEPVTASVLGTSLRIIANNAASLFTSEVTDGLSRVGRTSDFGNADDSLAVVSGLSAAMPDPLVTLVPVGPLAGGEGDVVSRPVMIDAASVLLAVAAPSSTLSPDFGTADDGVVVVTGLPGTPAASAPVTVGFLSTTALSAPVVLSTSFALIASNGAADGFGNTTDAIYRIDLAGPSLGPAINAGPLSESAVSRPVFLSATPDLRALVPNGGGSGAFTNSDDTVALLYTLDTAPQVFQIPSPGLSQGRRGEPVVVGPDLALTVGAGADLEPATPDDLINVLYDLDAADPTALSPCPSNPALECAHRERLFVSNLPGSPSARPLPLSVTQALVPTEGADGVMGTSDDYFQLIDTLDTPPGTAAAQVGLEDGGLSLVDARSYPVPGLSAGELTIVFRGNGGILFVVADPLGAAPEVEMLEIPELLVTVPSPVPVLPDLAVGIGPGPDGQWTTADDGFLLVFL